MGRAVALRCGFAALLTARFNANMEPSPPLSVDEKQELKRWKKLPPPTRRQLQILTLAYSTDKRSQQIADDLFISKRTVDFHLSTLYRKWNVRSCYQASNIAIGLGLLEKRQYDELPLWPKPRPLVLTIADLLD